MNDKLWIKLIIFILIISYAVFYYWNNPQPRSIPEKNPTFGRLGNYSILSISEIKKNYSSGTYNTDGFVIKTYKKNILISENSQLADDSVLSGQEMILFVNNPEQFQVGKKYNFSLKFLDSKTTKDSINDIEAIRYNDYIDFE